MPNKSSRKTFVILLFTIIVGSILYVYGPSSIQPGEYEATLSIESTSISVIETYNVTLLESGTYSENTFTLNGTSTIVEVTVPVSALVLTDNPLRFTLNATGDIIDADCSTSYRPRL